MNDTQRDDGAGRSGSGVEREVRARRVVCAAIRAADGSLLLGVRHYSRDMHEQIAWRRDGEKFMHRHDEDQGFVDQWGQWLSRTDAYALAKANGQIVRPEALPHALTDESPRLYSEGLY